MIVILTPSWGGDIYVKNAEGEDIPSMTRVVSGTVLIIHVIPLAAYDHMTTRINNDITRHNPCMYRVHHDDSVINISAEFCIKRTPCFLEDTPVLTPNGYRPIASLCIGDLVTTGSGGVSSIRAIKSQQTTPYAFSHPYVIPIGRYGA